MSSALHPYYQHLLSTLLERLVSPHFDEESWQEELEKRREVIAVKERIWARTPGELSRELTPYLDYIELLLELTLSPLKHMMGYRQEGERHDYTRLATYRGALLDERARVSSLLDAMERAAPHPSAEPITA